MKFNKIKPLLFVLTICFSLTSSKACNSTIEQMHSYLDNIYNNIDNNNTKSLTLKTIGIISKNGVKVCLFDFIPLNNISDSLKKVATLLQTEVASYAFLAYLNKLDFNNNHPEIKTILNKANQIKQKVGYDLIDLDQIDRSKMGTISQIINNNINILNTYLNLLPNSLQDQLTNMVIQAFANLNNSELTTLSNFCNSTTVNNLKNAISINSSIVDQIKTDIQAIMPNDMKQNIKESKELFDNIAPTLLIE